MLPMYLNLLDETFLNVKLFYLVSRTCLVIRLFKIRILFHFRWIQCHTSSMEVQRHSYWHAKTLSQKRIVFNYFQYIFSDPNNILPQTLSCIDLILTEKLKTKSIEVSDYKIITNLLLLNSTTSILIIFRSYFQKLKFSIQLQKFKFCTYL